MDLGLLGAFLGGVLTLLSPCSAMLLPAFFSYAFNGPSALISRTGLFYLGLITTLVPLGMLAGTLGSFVNQNRTTFVTVASVIVIALGLVMLTGVRVPAVSRAQATSGTSNVAVYLLGTVYGLAGVCAGPLLGAVLTYAAIGGSAAYGGVILLVFAAGMAFPLLLLALAWGRAPLVQRLVRPREFKLGPWRNTWTSALAGAFTVSVGVLLIVTQGTASLGGVLAASDQADLESWLMRTTNGIPDLLVAALAVIIAGGVWLAVRSYRRNPE